MKEGDYLITKLDNRNIIRNTTVDIADFRPEEADGELSPLTPREELDCRLSVYLANEWGNAGGAVLLGSIGRDWQPFSPAGVTRRYRNTVVMPGIKKG